MRPFLAKTPMRIRVVHLLCTLFGTEEVYVPPAFRVRGLSVPYPFELIALLPPKIPNYAPLDALLENALKPNHPFPLHALLSLKLDGWGTHWKQSKWTKYVCSQKAIHVFAQTHLAQLNLRELCVRIV